ncbi:unnamed protein product [Urochloa humidicola]
MGAISSTANPSPEAHDQREVEISPPPRSPLRSTAPPSPAPLPPPPRCRTPSPRRAHPSICPDPRRRRSTSTTSSRSSAPPSPPSSPPRTEPVPPSSRRHLALLLRVYAAACAGKSAMMHQVWRAGERKQPQVAANLDPSQQLPELPARLFGGTELRMPEPHRSTCLLHHMPAA